MPKPSVPTLALLAALGLGTLASCSQKDAGFAADDTAGSCDSPTLVAVSEDASVALGALVQLSAEAQVCADGDSATFTWTVETAPVESGIDSGDLELTDPAAPTFVPDVVGTYVVSVVATDSEGTRSPAEFIAVAVTSGNSAPVADCGPNLTADAGDRVVFDGSASRDPEGAPIDYAWALASGPDCTALSVGADNVFEHTTARASVVPDCAGVYVMGLAVSDGGTWSPVDYCSVTVGADNRPPVADAGQGGTLSPCTAQTYQLNAYGSYDPEGAELTYQWSLLSAPAGSAATDANFNDATLANPLFTWDVVGTYTFQLQVNDGEFASVPDVVLQTFQAPEDNYVPIANAGADVTVAATADCSTSSYTWTCEACPVEEIDLDASASIDPVDGDELTFMWSETSSSLSFDSRYSAITTAATPAYSVTYGSPVSRSWTVDLAVSDCADSDADSLVVTYTCTGTYTP